MSLDIQHKIKQNALEIREYVTDLYDWQKEMELKEKTKAQLRQTDKQKGAEVKEAEIRKPKEEPPVKAQPKETQNERKKDLIRDVNTVGDYYKAWDKFDADKELQRLEEEAQRPYKPYNPYEDSKNNKRAKPQTKINVSGRRKQVIDPTELKDKGNLHFQCLQFDKAISCYTECLTKLEEEGIALQDLTSDQRKLRCVVLSNRAMAYLKIQQTTKALADANLSLNYDDKYSKSYYRRAECYKKLEKYKESLKDFRTVKRLEPKDNKADAQIKKIEAFLAKRARQLRESLVIPYHESLLQGGRRIQIEEVDTLGEVEKSVSATNYLQEL